MHSFHGKAAGQKLVRERERERERGGREETEYFLNRSFSTFTKFSEKVTFLTL